MYIDCLPARSSSVKQAFRTLAANWNPAPPNEPASDIIASAAVRAAVPSAGNIGVSGCT